VGTLFQHWPQVTGAVGGVLLIVGGFLDLFVFHQLTHDQDLGLIGVGGASLGITGAWVAGVRVPAPGQ
jgi:hypothetical protein